MITITPLTRIEGHARITIRLDREGNVADARLHVNSLRGFEQFVLGREAEEVIRIVTRICGICPWMHHLAAVQAVEECFGVRPPPAAERLRELCLLLAHVGDKILHFFFLAAPDFLLTDSCRPRSAFALLQKYPELGGEAVATRRLAQEMLERVGGRAIHPVAAVAGGFSRPLAVRELPLLRKQARQLLDFSRRTLEFAGREVFDKLPAGDRCLDRIRTGFLGLVDRRGRAQFYRGRLRLVDAAGMRSEEFAPAEHGRFLAEARQPWSASGFPWASCWSSGFSLEDDNDGIYRVGPLARLNVAETLATPEAAAALDAFRSRFGRPVQETMLGHWARLVELLHVTERIGLLLHRDDICDDAVWTAVRPGPGRGVGCVEAPRGTLIHEYETDEAGRISRADLLVATSHNNAAMNRSVRSAAAGLIRNGRYSEEILGRIQMVVRAYDP